MIEFKRMYCDYTVLPVEKSLLHESTTEVISNAFAGIQKGLRLTDRVISSIEIEFLELPVKVIRAFRQLKCPSRA